MSLCRRSLNLGLVSSVRPGKGLELSVVTRSQTVVLKISKPRPSIQCEARQGAGAECSHQVTDCCTGMYMNMSLCRRSLNLGLVSSVRPGKGLELSVVTRSQTVVLRASNRVDHEQWLQSLVDAAALPNSNPFPARPGVLHFRYSSQNHHENIIERVKNFRCPSYAMMSEETTTTTPAPSGSYETSTSSSHSSDIGRSSGCMLRRVLSDSRTLLQRPYKRRNSARKSARLSKIAFSDTSIPVSSQEPTVSQSEKCQSMQELRNSVCMSEENVLSKCIRSESSKEIAKPTLSGSKESRLSNSIKIELNLEDIDPTNEEGMKEQKIGNVKITLDGCKIYGSTDLNIEPIKPIEKVKENGKYTENGKVDKRDLNIHLYNKEVRSETDLTVKQKTRAQSASCENMQTLDRSIGSTYNHATERIEAIGREQKMSNLIASETSGRKSNKKRSNSILTRFRDSRAENEDGFLERKGTIKKRLSFLRKVWKKRERKMEEEDYESADYDSIPDVIELPSPESEKAEQLLLSLERQEFCPEPEPPPDYDMSITEELEIPPMLPPRQKQRPVSPWHDVPKNNKPVLPIEPELPPPLPEKKGNRKTHHVLIKITENSSCIEQSLPSLGDDSVKCRPPSRNGEQKLEDLDVLLAQLSEVNTYVVRQIDVSETEEGNVVQVSAAPEPLYDVPRPHISLLATLRAQTARSEAFAPTHFLCTTPLIDTDSLDPVITRLDADITPDSLECESPWSLSHPTNSNDSSHSPSMMTSFITSEDKQFPDSLNS
ncbi:uncharacterized protein LOC128995351 [Macrosteles quadrilineatus]|uniref:uncharacterized protein LOC128995351 n=1 Tax=Macrosteles quadrilineatus TaxID=74068 RepID=UPI0023E22C9A|nr:uncharacterized protein LOC128995351 [Macrosteles quadrilineatus]